MPVAVVPPIAVTAWVVTVGAKGLQNSQIEIKLRSEKDSSLVPFDTAVSSVKEKVKHLYDSPK